VGAKTDIQISSFSTDSAIGHDFARIGRISESNTSVVLNIEPGAKGLNISPISSYIGEKERIFHGRFEVISIEKTVDIDTNSPFLNILIRQINNFVKEAK